MESKVERIVLDMASQAVDRGEVHERKNKQKKERKRDERPQSSLSLPMSLSSRLTAVKFSRKGLSIPVLLFLLRQSDCGLVSTGCIRKLSKSQPDLRWEVR